LDHWPVSYLRPYMNSDYTCQLSPNNPNRDYRLVTNIASNVIIIAVDIGL
jgi:hypothetical protein